MVMVINCKWFVFINLAVRVGPFATGIFTVSVLNLLSVNPGTIGLRIWKLWFVVIPVLLPAPLSTDIIAPPALCIGDGAASNIQF